MAGHQESLRTAAEAESQRSPPPHDLSWLGRGLQAIRRSTAPDRPAGRQLFPNDPRCRDLRHAESQGGSGPEAEVAAGRLRDGQPDKGWEGESFSVQVTRDDRL